jgi:hypothetical protein
VRPLFTIEVTSLGHRLFAWYPDGNALFTHNPPVAAAAQLALRDAADSLDPFITQSPRTLSTVPDPGRPQP